jgi:hypothetical protein
VRRAVLSMSIALVASGAAAQPARSAREIAPVDLTGYWVSVVTEDWAWRMRTPPHGDYASVPLNPEGKRVADTWTADQDGSCKAFGAAALLRNPTRVHITWEDGDTLKIETDNGAQTRRLHFGPAPSAPTHTLQGVSHAEWQIADIVRGSGADGGVVDTRLAEGPWAPLKVTTTDLSAAWLRKNGVPVSEAAVVTEYLDWFAEGDVAWFAVTTIVDDPKYLTERFVVSSNFRREKSGAGWAPRPCRP